MLLNVGAGGGAPAVGAAAPAAGAAAAGGAAAAEAPKEEEKKEEKEESDDDMVCSGFLEIARLDRLTHNDRASVYSTKFWSYLYYFHSAHIISLSLSPCYIHA